MSTSHSYTPEPGTITMFTTPWCGYCKRLIPHLDRLDIPYVEVDIEQHPDAAAVVQEVNDGNQTVPTVLYSDGSAATNPSFAQIQTKLAELA